MLVPISDARMKYQSGRWFQVRLIEFPGTGQDTRRRHGGSLSGTWRISGVQLANSYPVPIRYLVVPYTTPNEYLSNT